MDFGFTTNPFLDHFLCSIDQRNISNHLLFDYIQSDNISGIRHLIECGVDVCMKSNRGVTPLMISCGYGKVASVRILLETKRVNIVEKDNLGRNCLHHLCLGRHEDIDIFRLIQPRFLTQIRDNYGKLPLEYALELQLKTLSYLILSIDNNIDIKLCYDYHHNHCIRRSIQLNKYGFIMNDIHQLKSNGLNSISKKKERQNAMRKEKWKKMVILMKKGIVPKKFKHRLYKGIPDDYREVIWKLILFNLKEYEHCSKELYNNTLMYSKSSFDKQIDLDVKRTFSSHYKYSHQYCNGQKDLFYIMHSLVVRDNKMEYTQGLSCVPSMLTLFLDVECAYTATITLLQSKHKLNEMFNGFTTIQQCWIITKRLLKRRHPVLNKKLEELEILQQPLPFFIFEWHYLWFIEAFPFELSLRIFDIILYEGYTTLFVVADTIFHFLEKDLMKQKNSNVLQQQLKQPFSLMKKPPTTNEFIEYMYTHRLKKKEKLECISMS
ncbi:Rab-GAP TBC domain-containing protein [Entamoeba marina]